MQSSESFKMDRLIRTSGAADEKVTSKADPSCRLHRIRLLHSLTRRGNGKERRVLAKDASYPFASYKFLVGGELLS